MRLQITDIYEEIPVESTLIKDEVYPSYSFPAKEDKIQLWNQTRILSANLDQIIANPYGLDLYQQVNNIYIRAAVTKIITGDLNHVSNRWTMLQKSIKRSDDDDDSILDLDLENF